MHVEGTSSVGTPKMPASPAMGQTDDIQTEVFDSKKDLQENSCIVNDEEVQKALDEASDAMDEFQNDNSPNYQPLAPAPTPAPPEQPAWPAHHPGVVTSNDLKNDAKESISEFRKDHDLNDVENMVRSYEESMKEFSQLIEEGKLDADNIRAYHNDEKGSTHYVYFIDDNKSIGAWVDDGTNKPTSMQMFDDSKEGVTRRGYDSDGDGIIDQVNINKSENVYRKNDLFNGSGMNGPILGSDGGEITGVYRDSNEDGKIDAKDGGIIRYDEKIKIRNHGELKTINVSAYNINYDGKADYVDLE